MRDMKRGATKQRQMTLLDKHQMAGRRTANYNAHVITPHGKIQSGRKGRRG
ncbi:MAG TPA: hypothetical protein VEM32_05020 [Geobacteraceae bacterium]|nr:hypothetical protein [Geobacteraceae bacterium]